MQAYEKITAANEELAAARAAFAPLCAGWFCDSGGNYEAIDASIAAPTNPTQTAEYAAVQAAKARQAQAARAYNDFVSKSHREGGLCNNQLLTDVI